MPMVKSFAVCWRHGAVIPFTPTVSGALQKNPKNSPKRLSRSAFFDIRSPAIW